MSLSAARAAPTRRWGAGDMEARIVRYRDLRPCYNAFIDTRSPGSEAKENFCVIGPGVAENPLQHVHIREAHGFNIGGARQPPGCVNSQHSHETAEVFVVHSGRWSFNIGERGEDAKVILGPGDVISLPTRMFRGFTNIGDDVGYLFAVLGGDDPGRVLWAPYVFDMARDFGLVLLENGELIDTVAGQIVPPHAQVMPRTRPEQVAMMTKPTQPEAESLAWRAPARSASGVTPIIGGGGPFGWEHGFTLDRIDLAPGDNLPLYVSKKPEVMFVQSGDVSVSWADGVAEIGPGDTLTTPVGLERAIGSTNGAIIYRVNG
ncbi:MAG: cupin domain-containing protein [Parvularculaceae bacterium]|nr:cupin domain-containing protein [Parvularculaceae bacterium]